MYWLILALLVGQASPSAAAPATEAADPAAFAQAITTCRPTTLRMAHPLMRGFTIVHRIEGERDDLCHYTQAMPAGMRMECAFTRAGGAAFAAEFSKLAAGHLRGSSTEKPAWADECVIVTRDGKQLPVFGESVACDLDAWSNGRTEEERRIHAGRGEGTPVLATMPPPEEFEDFVFRVELEVTGARDGWFRVDRATTTNTIVEEPLTTVFEGDGWVPGEFLGLLLNHSRLYAGPSTTADVVATLSGTGADGVRYGPDSTRVERLLDCRGDWVLVAGTLEGRPVRGWAPGTCASQLTTCP